MALYQASLIQTINGSDRPVVNVFEITTGDGPGGIFTSDIADRVRSQWAANIMSYQNSALTLREVRIRQIGGVEFFDLQVSIPGGHGGQAVPPNVSWLAKKTTPGLARKRWGSMYLAGMPEDLVDHGGNITPLNRTQYGAQLEAFRAGLATDGIPMCQILRTAPPVRSVISVHLVSKLELASKVATQRRRLRK